MKEQNVIEIYATSFTTGQRKKFKLTEKEYEERLNKLPAWNFDEESMKLLPHPLN